MPDKDKQTTYVFGPFDLEPKRDITHASGAFVGQIRTLCTQKQMMHF